MQQVINPWDGSVVGSFTWATPEETEAALATLARGKEVAASMPAFERAEILLRLADLMDADADSLAALITREIGKTLRDSRIELQRAANTVRCSAEEARRLQGKVLDSDAWPPARGRWGLVHRRPLGIVLAITPFNFPINLAVHKLGPAFAAGCPVFFKPGPANVLSGRRLTELAHEAGVPPELLQCCVPDVPVLREVVRDDRIAVISFTGGVPTAHAIAADAGPKKLLLELGGNDPLMVFDDADVSKAVATTIAQRFGTAGQRCTAAKRVFVHEAVFDRFRDELVAATEQLVVGDPMDEATFVGPVVNERAAALVLARVEAAVAEGATLLTGGRREGTLVWPTVLEGVPDTAVLCADETFGPVVPLFSFADEDELVRRVNSTPFVLQAGLFTNDMARVKRLFERLDVGAVAVNDGPGFRAEHFPFGGVKQSGLGREGVRSCIAELTTDKVLIW